VRSKRFRRCLRTRQLSPMFHVRLDLVYVFTRVLQYSGEYKNGTAVRSAIRNSQFEDGLMAHVLSNQLAQRYLAKVFREQIDREDGSGGYDSHESLPVEVRNSDGISRLQRLTASQQYQGNDLKAAADEL